MAAALVLAGVAILCVLRPETALANDLIRLPSISVTPAETDNPQQTATAVQMLFLLAIIALVPTLAFMVTCFPRIIISLHFIRSALGTQQMPPNQVLIGLALFMTLFIMNGQISEINETALKPYSEGIISQQEAIDNTMKPIREFMLDQVSESHLNLFAQMADVTYSKSDPDTIPNTALIPAFMVSEITAAFKIGVLIYIPFIVIDMVVASVLMAMGMMMLPPAMISLPFKIILFVLVDGWALTLKAVFESFLR